MTNRIEMLGFGIALLLASSARADQFPPLQGEPSVHAWSVPGVVSGLSLGTVFTCTNTLRSRTA